MKNGNEIKDKDRLDVIPKELQRLSKGILQELEDEHPEAVENSSLEVIDQLIRQELSRILGLQQLAEQCTAPKQANSYQAVYSKLRSFLLSQTPDKRNELFRPLANEMGYYSWNQFIQKLNIISQASKGSIK